MRQVLGTGRQGAAGDSLIGIYKDGAVNEKRFGKENPIAKFLKVISGEIGMCMSVCKEQVP